MNDYKPLTKRLIELNAAVFCCPEAGHGCEHAKERATAKYHLAVPIDEYVAVALAAVTALEQDEDELGELADCPSCGHELCRGAHDDGCWYVALKDALDALQEAVVR